MNKRISETDIVDDAVIKKVSHIREIAKSVSSSLFENKIECDFIYIVNEKSNFKSKGCYMILIKNRKVLDIFGPVLKIKIVSEPYNGETIELNYIATNQMKIKHPYFKLFISKMNNTILIEPRNIFKTENLYNK